MDITRVRSMSMKLALAAAIMAAGLALAGCSNNSSTSTTSSTSSTEGSATSAATETATTAAGSSASDAVDYSTITIDKEAKTVTIWAQVNGKYFTESTRHGIVFKDGGNGEKALMRGMCSQLDFYQALIEIGAEPGNNLSLPVDNGATVEGDKLNVTVTWDGASEAVAFEDCLKTGSGDSYVADFRFGGNYDNAKDKNTGCILCLDSCPVGIASSAANGFGSIEGTKTLQVYGNSDVLPADGTYVQVQFELV